MFPKVWQRKTVTFPGLAPFPALVDPFKDNFGNHLIVTDKNGPNVNMKAHPDQLSAPRLQDYDAFVKLEETYIEQIDRQQLMKELEQLVAKTRKDHPAVAAILLTLSAAVHAGHELKMARHVQPWSEAHRVALMAFKASEN